MKKITSGLKKLLLCILLNISFVNAYSQVITIDNANLETGTYGQGRSIAVPFSTTGCFNTNNEFQVWLSDNSGSFASEVMIGTLNAYSAHFINGVIPGAQAAGNNYRVRIKSTSPATTSVANTANLDIAASAGPALSVTAAQPARILRPNQVYGWCTPNSSANLILSCTADAGATLSSTLINHSTGQITNPSIASPSFSVPLTQSYYTFIAKSEVSGVISTVAYYFVNTSVNLNIATSGQQSGCLPDTLQFSIIINGASGISTNFPQTTYSVDWGDGVVETHTQCNLIAAGGILKHLYEETSCNLANSAFNVTISANNAFAGYDPNVACDEPVVQSFARIFRRPEASFTKPANILCVNNAYTFNNASTVGTTSGAGNVCVEQAYFTWYINGNIVYTSASPESTPPNLIHTFTTLGTHYIQLDVDNGTCGIDTYLDSVCIEPVPVPGFAMSTTANPTQVTALSGCAPMDVNIHDLSNNSANPCRNMNYNYSVLNFPSLTAAPTSAYYFTGSGNTTIPEPAIRFLEDGEYVIRQTLSNSCGTFTIDRRVTITANASVDLPAAHSYCGLQTISFNSPNHTPVYNTNAGNESYNWTVSGGAYSFVGGTTAASQYPQIQFNDYATYTVTIEFTNDCGTQTDVQDITFYQQATASVNNDTTICFNTTLLQLNGVTTGPNAGYSWAVISGDGSLSATNILNPVYTFSANDKSSGTVRLRFTVNRELNSVCTSPTDDIVITIRPDNIVNIPAKSICSGENVNQTITSSLPGSTYTWTASVTSGSATGFTASGTGALINDVLVNSSTTANAEVTYSIIASRDGCSATAKTFVVTIRPNPAFTLSASSASICSGQPVTISMSSGMAAIRYTWSASSHPDISGTTFQSTPAAVNDFINTLTNTGTGDVTITYTVTAYGPAPNNCEGETKTIDVIVRPGPSAANAGANDTLCNATSANITGNIPVVGTGQWSQSATDVNAAIITNVNNNNTSVTGLQPGIYNFIWTITPTAGSCTPSRDTVTIVVRPDVTTADAGNNELVCDFTATSNHTVSLNANSNPSRPFEIGTWTLVSPASGGSFSNVNSPTSTFTFTAPNVYTIRWTITNDAGCTASSDDITVSAFALPDAGTLAASDTLCTGSNGTLNVSGTIGNIVKWQSSTDGTSWNDVANTTSSLSYTNLTQATHYRVIVESDGKTAGCNNTDTSNIAVITIRPDVTTAEAGTSNLICDFNTAGTNSVTLAANSNPARPFETGTWTLVSPATGGSFSNINNPAATFTVTQTGIYTLRWTITNDAGCTASSDDVVVSVFALPESGTLGNAATICSGGSGVLNLSGSSGDIAKWQSSTDGTTWSDIVNTTNTYNYTNLLQTTLYRVIVQSSGDSAGCTQADTSNIVTIRVDAPSNGGILHSDTALCGVNNSGSFYVSGYTGNIVRWEFSTDGGTNWNVISNTNDTYSFTNIPATRIYRVVVKNGVCGEAYSNQITVTVNSTTSVATAGRDTILCNATSYTMQAVTPSVGTGLWTQYGASTANIVSPNAGNTVINNLTANTSYNFVWTVTGFASCPDTKDTVIITVRPDISNANAGIDTTICNFTPTQNNQLTLYANAPAHSFETGSWRILSGNSGSATIASPNQHNSLITFSASGTYELEWSMSNDAGCTPKRDTIIINLFDKPVAGNIVASATDICQGQTVNVSMNGQTGNVYAWQTHAQPFTGTAWVTVVGNVNPFVINNATDTIMVRGIVISNGTCISYDTSAAVTINIAPPTRAGNTDADAIVCASSNNGTITLSNHIGNVVRWESSIDNGANWSPINVTATSITYNNISATTWYRAIVQSGMCSGSPSDTTIISVSAPVTPAIAGVDKHLCNLTFTDLSANTPLGTETGEWSQFSGPNTATLTSTNTPLITVSNLIPGTYRFIWTIKNNVCPDTRDTVDVIVYPAIENKIDTAGITVCETQNVSITGQTATGGNGSYTYQWQSSPDGIVWTDIAGATNESYNFTPTATVYIRRLVNSGPCALPSDYKIVTMQPGISNNAIAANQNVCVGVDPAIIVGSTPAGADGNFIYQWESSVDGINWTIINTATSKDYEPPVLSVNTQFRRTVSSILCNGPQVSRSNVITITIKPDSEADFTFTQQTGCAPFTIDDNNIKAVLDPVKNGTYNWYANNNFIAAGTSFPGYTIVNTGDSVRIKLVTLSADGCEPDSMEVKFYTYPQPQTGFTASDTVGCAPLTVSFVNTTPNINAFNYFWDFGNGVTSNVANPPSVTFAANPTFNDTIYKVKLTAATPCVNIDSTVLIRVKSKPRALFAPDKTIGCSPMTVTFNNISRGSNATYYWDFGDGATTTTNTLAGVSHIYHTPVQDTFTVRLIAENECGRDTLYYNIITAPNSVQLDFAVNGNEVNGCAPHVVNFINNSTGGTTFHWNFGDGNTTTTTKNIDTIVHVYNIPGTYNVYLNGSNGCSDTTGLEVINVFQKPTVDFAADKYQACVGDTIRFTNQSTPNISYLWKFGDGNTSTLVNPQYKYTSAGTYTVWLIVTRQNSMGNSCIDSIPKTVTIGSTLAGAYTFTQANACDKFTVTFTNQSLPAGNVIWNFGDGQTGSGDVVTHTYAANGTYNVTMQATAPGGCIYAATNAVTVAGTSGTFNYSGGYKCDFVPVRFEIQNPIGIDSVRWDFGDGTFATTNTFITYYTYANTGIYIPKAEILSGATCRKLLRGLDTIKMGKVEAGFTHIQKPFCGYTTLSFTDTSRSYFNGNTYEWFFGAGANSTLRNPEHSFTTTGNYNIMLVTTGQSGCRDTATQTIFVKVNDIPSADIDAPDTACVRNAVTFISNVTSVDPVTNYSWDMGVGAGINTSLATATYVTPGNYNIRLIVGTASGCYDTVHHPIYINPSPVTSTIPDVAICRGTAIQLPAAGASSYLWTPSQGLSCTTCPVTMAAPNFTTSYVVRGFNSFGCSTTDTVTVTVHQPIDITVSDRDSICVGQSATISASGAQIYQWSPALGLSSSTGQVIQASPAVTTTYRVIGFDGNSCFTDTAFITVAVGKWPTVNLGPDKTLAAGMTMQLAPSVTNGPITSWNWSNGIELSCYNCPNPIATVKDNACTNVTVTTAFGCTASDTMCVETFCESSQVFIPNAFTPDGDGQNDILMVRGTGVKLVKSFRVFNRWGQVVFERTNFQANAPQYGWDGKVNGVTAPPDVYVYTCELVCEKGVPYTYKGNVAILK